MNGPVASSSPDWRRETQQETSRIAKSIPRTAESISGSAYLCFATDFRIYQSRKWNVVRIYRHSQSPTDRWST